MIRDRRGRTPRFVLVADPDGSDNAGDRLLLNQFTGRTARCNRYDEKSVRVAFRTLETRETDNRRDSKVNSVPGDLAV